MSSNLYKSPLIHMDPKLFIFVIFHCKQYDEVTFSFLTLYIHLLYQFMMY